MAICLAGLFSMRHRNDAKATIRDELLQNYALSAFSRSDKHCCRQLHRELFCGLLKIWLVNSSKIDRPLDHWGSILCAFGFCLLGRMHWIR